MAETRVYRICGMRLRSTLPLPELTRVAGPRAHCAVEVSRAALSTTGVNWFHHWRADSRTTWLRIGRRNGAYVLRFPGLVDFDVSGSGARIVAHPAAGLPRHTLRHLLLDQVLPLALGRMGRMPLHASAVHVPGFGAIAFAGAAGCGKSTLAAALAREGCAILSDDCLVVVARGNRVFAVPSYGGVRLWPDAARRLGYRGRRVSHYSDKVRVGPAKLRSGDRPVRLRAVFLLAGPSSSARGLAVSARSPRDLFIGLVRYAYLLDFEDRPALTRLFHQLGALSERVAIAGLRLPNNPRRLPELARAVRDLAGRLAVAQGGAPTADSC